MNNTQLLAKQCCWGILGAAKIAHKNWLAIHHSGNGYIKSVASRSLQRAKTLIDDCSKQAPFAEPVIAVDDYRKIVDDPKIDAVYIPLPTVQRTSWAKAALQAGKHLLIEKPCACSAEELQTLIEIARTNRLMILDGVMFVHSERFNALRSMLADGGVGDVRRITSQFSFATELAWMQSNIRANANFEPFGCLGDLGWYCIRLAVELTGQLPTSVIGRNLQTFQHSTASAAVPIEFEGSLYFKDRVTVNFYCSFVTDNQQWAHISGSDGWVAIEDFVLPYFGRQPQFDCVKSESSINGCDFRMLRSGRVFQFDEPACSAAGSQESLLFRNFAAAAISGNIDYRGAELALKTEQTLDGLVASAAGGGVTVELTQ